MIDSVVEFIKYNRDTLDLILDLVPIPLFVKDRASLYIDCNIAFTKFLSFRREDIIGKSVYQIWNKEEADIFFAQDNDLFKQGGLQVYETQITSSDGLQHIVEFQKQVFTDANGLVAGFLGAIFDITEKKRLENSLAQLAAIDELTGLPNRRAGMKRLEALHADSQSKIRPYCLAMVDIDHYKRINDAYGHNVGDIVLKAFSDFLVSSLRAGDSCFRYGGEEFVILLPETTLNDAYAVVERLRQAWAMNDLTLGDCQKVKSTISVGLTQNTESAASFEQLLQESDKALYAAKSKGRNCTVCFQI